MVNWFWFTNGSTRDRLGSTTSGAASSDDGDCLHEEQDEQPREMDNCFATCDAFNRVLYNGHVTKNG